MISSPQRKVDPMERKHLDMLKIGESARIRRVDISDEILLRKLTDMGLTPGTEVRLIKFAPMGDPMELHLRGYSLSLRKSDAAAIELMDEDEEKADIEREEKLMHPKAWNFRMSI